MNKGIQHYYLLTKRQHTVKVLTNLNLIFRHLSLLESPTPATKERGRLISQHETVSFCLLFSLIRDFLYFFMDSLDEIDFG